MKRIWLGVGFLVALLVIGITVMQITDHQMSHIFQPLQQASQARDFATAIALAQTAQTRWEENSHLMAALSDHADIDNIEELFALLNIYEQRNEPTDHAAVCAQLSKAILDLQEKHRLTWWNLL